MIVEFALGTCNYESAEKYANKKNIEVLCYFEDEHNMKSVGQAEFLDETINNGKLDGVE
jgi:hypothetical protein